MKASRRFQKFPSREREIREKERETEQEAQGAPLVGYVDIIVYN